MRCVRTWLAPSALLVALAAAVGCGGNNKGGHESASTPEGDAKTSPDNPDADVGPRLFNPSGEIPKSAPISDRPVTDLIIPNATVQYEDRQQVAAEVEANIDLIAVKPKLLPRGTYLVEQRPDGSMVAYEPGRDYTGVTVVNGVPHRDTNGAKAPLAQLPQDALVHERRPDGSVTLLPGEVFRKGTFVVERRPDRSVVPFDPAAKYTPRKTDDGGTVTIVTDAQNVPQWETKDKDGKATRTPLDEWPDNSIIGERRPDGSIVLSDLSAKFPGIVLHPRDQGERVPYCKLSDGDIVERGEEICFLDDQMVTARMEAAQKTAAAARFVQVSARKGVDLTNEKLKISLDLYKKGTLSYSDLLNDQVTLTRFEENLAQATQTIAKAESDYKEARVLMRKHRVISRVNGVIRNVVQRPGQFVKSGEKILDIQSTEKVRLEGNLDVQYAGQVARGQLVVVEPAIPSAPIKSHALHRSEVTGVVVTPHPTRPLVVSTSADGSALVWEPDLRGMKKTPNAGHILPHPVPVRSVASGPFVAAGPTPSVLVVTGADDGKVRIWELGNPDKLPTAPKVVPADAHSSAVLAVAFSPDGKFFATAAGREVFIWDAETGKKRYAMPAEHRDTVTSLQFTPQANLVTVAKDRTVKLWKLGSDKAAVMRTIDHRSGTVDVLGVSKDGGRVLFDQDKSRIDVVSLADKQTVGQIQTPGSTAAFATLALFSQDEKFILTAGGEGELKGVLQVWTAPQPGNRGSEVARLVTPGRVGVTCGAFSPVADVRFLVVGTQLGTVHVWTPPAEAQKKYEGKVMNVDETDPRYVTVRVEMDNKELKLRDRSAATIIVPGR